MEARDAHALVVKSRDAGTDDDFTVIGLIKSVEDGGDTVGKIDWSHSLSPNRMKQYKIGWRDSGEWSAELHYDPEGYDHVTTAVKASMYQDFEVSLPVGPEGEDGFTDAFSGFYLGRPTRSFPTTEDETISMSVSWQPTTEIETTPITDEEPEPDPE